MCVGHSSFLPSRKKFHVFVWDSAPDVNLLGETSVFLRLTRFEDVRGDSATTETNLVLDNETFLDKDASVVGGDLTAGGRR